MKNTFLLLIFLFSSAWVHAQSPSATFPAGEATELVTEKGTLKGTLLLPSSPGKVPVVLILSGSGPTDREGNNPAMKNNSLKMVAEGLYGQGIASVRYDKRGIVQSREAAVSEFDLRFDHYVQDAAAWVLQLQKDPRFGKVIVLGHSEGSLIGMIAAKKAKANGFISVAGAGQSADKIIRQQLQTQPKQVTEVAWPILEQLAQGKAVPEVNPMLASLFRPSVQPYLISWFKYDPQAEIAKLSIPVLVVQGKEDLQVSGQDAHLLKTAASNGHLVEIDNMNHVLKETTADRNANLKTYGNPMLPLASPLVPALVEYVNSLK